MARALVAAARCDCVRTRRSKERSTAIPSAWALQDLAIPPWDVPGATSMMIGGHRDVATLSRGLVRHDEAQRGRIRQLRVGQLAALDGHAIELDGLDVDVLRGQALRDDRELAPADDHAGVREARRADDPAIAAGNWIHAERREHVPG